MKVFILVYMVTTSLYAMVCRQQTMPSICGSGEVVFAFKGDEYYLRNGDVSCWYSDASYSGLMTLANPNHEFPFANAYSLLEGHITVYQAKDKLLLKLKDRNAFDGIRGLEYILDCTESNEIKYNRVSMKTSGWALPPDQKSMRDNFLLQIKSNECMYPKIIGDGQFSEYVDNHTFSTVTTFAANYFCDTSRDIP